MNKRQRWEFQQRWREVYAARLHAKTGKWILGDFDWHLFTSNDVSYVDGLDAREEFRRIGVSSYCLFSDLLEYGTYQCKEQKLPTIEQLYGQAGQTGGMSEVYVIEWNLRWVFIMTHEEDWGFGPYFSRANWQTEFPPGKIPTAQLEKLHRIHHRRHGKRK